MTALKKIEAQQIPLSKDSPDLELCHCRRVKQSFIINLVDLGALSLQEITQRSGAGSGCGTCRPLIAIKIDQKNKND